MSRAASSQPAGAPGGGTENKNLHTTVRHRHGVVCRGIAGDLAVVGTGGGGKNVARVDKVGAGGVSPAMRPEKGQPGHLF